MFVIRWAAAYASAPSVSHGVKSCQIGHVTARVPRVPRMPHHAEAPMRGAPLDALQFIRPITVHCEYHEGTNGQLQIEQWDGTSWKVVSEWSNPLRDVGPPEDRGGGRPGRQAAGRPAARLKESEAIAGRRRSVARVGGSGPPERVVVHVALAEQGHLGGRWR